MTAIRFAAAAALMFGLAAFAWAEKADTNKEKIVGTWEAVKGDLPKGSTVEFTKDSKLKLTVVVDKNKVVVDGTYTVDGDNLKLTMKGPDGKEQKETLVIQKLTATDLVTKDEKGKLDEFKRQGK
jgi:uncharacterized protein (TIGR03066 family)